MSGRDPWEGRDAFSTQTQSSPFSRANLPFLAATVVAVGALVAFILLADPFSDTETAAATTTTLGSTTSSAPASSAATEGSTASTTAGTEDTTVADGSTTLPSNLPPLQGLALEPLASGIPFPVFATALPGDNRIFVLERQGRVVVVDDTGLQSQPFLDLTDRVGSGGIENGLLGMAFHPDYADNGKFYVYYTDTDLDSRLSEFTTSGAGAEVADSSTERILFEVDQQGIRHRAGMLQFGPDGYLWSALGDGGLGDDSAQNLDTLQGNILRLDVDSGNPYSVPATNPFADGNGGRAEIWAWGLRNPWRYSVDPVERLIYIGDVGQADVEEINIASIDDPGLDFGWPNFEGTNCYQPSDGCDMTGWVEPVVSYSHEFGCSVTGGYVYRGSQIPELVGHYFYADWCNGMVRSFLYSNGQVTDEQDWSSDLEGDGQVASFGIDGSGEMLLVDSNGSIYRIVPVR